MKKIMIQKITQNNWNFWTVNLIMRAKKLLTIRHIFPYAVPARTVTKKHWYGVAIQTTQLQSVLWKLDSSGYRVALFCAIPRLAVLTTPAYDDQTDRETGDRRQHYTTQAQLSR